MYIVLENGKDKLIGCLFLLEFNLPVRRQFLDQQFEVEKPMAGQSAGLERKRLRRAHISPACDLKIIF
jgi:hypothetical protein